MKRLYYNCTVYTYIKVKILKYINLCRSFSQKNTNVWSHKIPLKISTKTVLYLLKKLRAKLRSLFLNCSSIEQYWTQKLFSTSALPKKNKSEYEKNIHISIHLIFNFMTAKFRLRCVYIITLMYNYIFKWKNLNLFF